MEKENRNVFLLERHLGFCNNLKRCLTTDRVRKKIYLLINGDNLQLVTWKLPTNNVH